MPLATRADIEAKLGVDTVAELLNRVVPAGASAEQAEAARQARLDDALREGDILIKQFIDLPGPNADPDDVAVLRAIAVKEAIFDLLFHSHIGAGADDHEAAKQRRRDLTAMRKREQKPGTTKGQASHRPRIVPAQGRYTTEVKRRYY